MDPEGLLKILEAVERGEMTADSAAEKLRTLPFKAFKALKGFEDLGYAKIDHHRCLRRGFPEVIFGPGKSPSQIAAIAARLAEQGQIVLVTKTTEEAFRAVADAHPDAVWHEDASAITVGRPTQATQATQERVGKASVLSAGTSDIPVAEEAALTAELMGASVGRLYDVGVAGLHRLLEHIDVLASADVLVVVAGMDGALPAVVSGLSRAPVIAVPTSVGYGASFSGLSALLAMLNGCSPGVAVVNIDNGFGGGYLAGLLCQPTPRLRPGAP